MNIYIDVAQYYDYTPGDGPGSKVMADGSTQHLVLVDSPSQTQVVIHQQQIDHLVNTSKQLAEEIPGYKALSEEDAVVLCIERAMVDKAPLDAWGKIEVHDNQPVEKYLNKYFKEKQNENREPLSN